MSIIVSSPLFSAYRMSIENENSLTLPVFRALSPGTKARKTGPYLLLDKGLFL